LSGPGAAGSAKGAAAANLGGDAQLEGDENNDSFAHGVPLLLNADHRAWIRGWIGDSLDVDVYDLGPTPAGDRVVAEVTADSGLDPAVGVFDDDGDLVILHDDWNVYKGMLSPSVDVVLRRDCGHCYIVVVASPKSATTGSYTLYVEYELSVDDPELPEFQVVYLDFDGGSDVKIGGRKAVSVPPFEATVFANYVRPHVDAFLSDLVAKVREDFTGLDVIITTSLEEPPPDEEHSTVFFGTFDAELLGVADNVDEYNARQVQEAIVFTDTFEAFFVVGPTLDELSSAMANVASHEVGHLLGLNHTRDPRGVMDVTASLRQMLVDQSFVRSPLESAVFPVGDQDALELLYETTGGDWALIEELALEKSALKAIVDDGAEPARHTHVFSNCAGQRCGLDQGKGAELTMAP